MRETSKPRQNGNVTMPDLPQNADGQRHAYAQAPHHPPAPHNPTHDQIQGGGHRTDASMHQPLRAGAPFGNDSAEQQSTRPAHQNALIPVEQESTGITRYLPRKIKLPGKFPRRQFVLACEICAAICLIAVVVLSLAYFRLLQGPIDLGFLTSPIEGAINRELLGLKVRIEGAIVRFSKGDKGSGTGLQFRLKNVQVLDQRGATIARAPFAAVGLSGSALLAGSIAPASVDFIRPRLLLSYDENSGLALRFSEWAGGEDAAAKTETGQTNGNSNSASTNDPQALQSINIAETVSRALAEARQRTTAGAYLTRFGVQDAIVIFEQDNVRRFWSVPEFSLNFNHRKKRSTITGTGSVTSESGPWGIAFRAEESEKRKSIRVAARIAGFPLIELAAGLPVNSMFRQLAPSVSGDIDTEIADDGTLLSAMLKLQHGRYERNLSGPNAAGSTKSAFDAGTLNARYLVADNRWEILPSTFVRGTSRITLSGHIKPVVESDGSRSLAFDVRADGGEIGDDEFGLAASEIRKFHLRGRTNPSGGWTYLDQSVLALEDGAIAIAGQMSRQAGIQVEGNFSSMPVDTLKRIWPADLKTKLRRWIGRNVSGGIVQGGRFSLNLPAQFANNVGADAKIPEEAITFEANFTGSAIQFAPDVPAVVLGQTSISIKDAVLRIKAPSGHIDVPGGGRILLKNGIMSIKDLRPDEPDTIFSFSATSSFPDAKSFIRNGIFSKDQIGPDLPLKADGKVNADVRIGLKVSEHVLREEIDVSGRAKVVGVGAKKIFGDIDMHDGTINIEFSNRTIEVNGNVLLNGVAAKVKGLRIIGARPEQQPPLRFIAVLDDADRDQLGMELNHIVKGPMSVVVSLANQEGKFAQPQVRADLTNAELMLEGMSWRKAPGRKATVEFDVARGRDDRIELHNFKIVGQPIAIEGWLALGADDRLSAFHFPEFTLDVITKLEVEGRLRDDNVWDIKVSGPRYDGKDFLRSLFSAEKLGQSTLPPDKRRAGLDISATIGSVLGFSNQAISNVNFNLKRRKGRLIEFDARGDFDSGAPLAVHLGQSPDGARALLAETTDAGTAFSFVGLYSNIKGGEASLRVNLDQSGQASKTGILWTRKFIVLGDPVVNQVLSDTPNKARQGTGKNIRKRRKSKSGKQRQELVFDQMRIPFSVGQGQFVLHDSFINGPVLGATLRGSVDFNRQTVRLGGTYVPLYGLNSAVGWIPLLGNLLVGRQGEGILGITFAIQGPIANPRVDVNPISLIAPGIFRQIFEYIPSQKINPVVNGTVHENIIVQQSGSASEVFTGPTSPNSVSTPGKDQNWTIENVR